MQQSGGLVGQSLKQWAFGAAEGEYAQAGEQAEQGAGGVVRVDQGVGRTR